MKTTSFKDLIVWQKSIELVEACYKLSKQLPSEEKFALSNQLTRAAVSIPSNIAEGYRRNGRQEYLYYCSIAAGSAAEVETQLVIIEKVYGLDANAAFSLNTEVQKLLYTFIKQLKAKP